MFTGPNQRAFHVSSIQDANENMESDRNTIFFHQLDVGQLGLDGYPCVITHAKWMYMKNAVIGFPFQKNSPYQRMFSYFLLQMRESGHIDRLLTKHHTYLRSAKPKHEACQKKGTPFFQDCMANEPNCVPAIKIETVWTSLLVLLLGTVIGFFIVVIERMNISGLLSHIRCISNNMCRCQSLGRNHILIICSIIFVVFSILFFRIFVEYFRRSFQIVDVKSFYDKLQ